MTNETDQSSSTQRSRSSSMKRPQAKLSPEQLTALEKDKPLAKKKCRCDKDIIMRDCPFHKAHYLKENEVYQTPKPTKLSKKGRKNKSSQKKEPTEQKKLDVKEVGGKFQIQTKNRFEAINPSKKNVGI